MFPPLDCGYPLQHPSGTAYNMMFHQHLPSEHEEQHVAVCCLFHWRLTGMQLL